MICASVFRIAVYGKGGVGKSTISSNLSLLLSEKGSVLHVGCDPKHDSTRLLMNGTPIRTFQSAGFPESMEIGPYGIGCIECGGPEPGMGCAGKGLDLLFSEISDVECDYRVSDVLGDVVCGGFSVPARKDNCDGILIVTSGEFMSLYAANNILRGLGNLRDDGCVIGLVLNRRGDPGEELRARRFSEAVGIPVVCDIGRSDIFRESESMGVPLAAAFPDSAVAEELRELSELVSGHPDMYVPSPLPEESMMDIASGRPVGGHSRPERRRGCSFDDYDSERNLTYAEGFVMPACTSHGAADMGMRVSDMAVVLHGPRNCAYLMEYAFRRRMAMSSGERGGRIPECGLYSTGMDGRSASSDPRPIVKREVSRAVADGYRHVVIVPTCAAEIIGTDLRMIASDLSKIYGADVRALCGDGSFLKSKFGGTLSMAEHLISFMRPCERNPDTANLISRWFYGVGKDANLRSISYILGTLGIRINTTFPDCRPISDIEGFCSGGFDIQIGRAPMNAGIAKMISERTGRRTALALDIPAGLSGASEWVRMICRYTGRPDADMESALSVLKGRFEEIVSARRPVTSERRAVVYCMMERNLDWQMETLKALGIDLRAVLIVPGTVTDHNVRITDYGDVRIVRDATPDDLRRIASEEGAEIVVTNDPDTVSGMGLKWAPLGARSIGMDAVSEWSEILADCIRLPNADWEAGL